ncbi:MAG: iron-sulfur cluster assembly accessory protein [Balneolaceae bacterium]|nr:MAG: iron-sulfur cluster assembly accessory protein [Balneolaceae bacterium]
MEVTNGSSSPPKTEIPVSLTERAARQIKKIIEEEELPSGHILRIAVKGGGCSGLSYSLGFDERTDNDEYYTTQGVDVIVDKRHILYLSGISVDFHDGLDARGFVFNNPNATSTCGCGTSFSA